MNVNNKLTVSAIIVIIAVVAMPLASVFLQPTPFSGEQQSGIVIDFEENNTAWAPMSLDDNPDPISALEEACDYNGFSYDIDGSTVNEINGYVTSMSGMWEVWVVKKGSKEWTKADTSIDNRDYTLVAWAYRTEGYEPNIGVDFLGKSVYGFVNVRNIVTIAPSVTEIVSSIGASELITGTDLYSNYPDSVQSRKDSGEIKVVGGYTNPSYEEVLRCEPDLVFCYGGQQTHMELATKLNSVGYNAIVLHDGEDIEAILENIFIAGVVLNYSLAAADTIESIESSVNDVYRVLRTDGTLKNVDVMLSLSTVKSPWVSGSGTYMDDVLQNTYAVNVYDYKKGWIQANPESIVSNNPEIIIIMSSDFVATQSEYDAIIKSLEPEWTSTDAYKNKNIYLFCESFGDIAQRPSPRIAQLVEIVARTLHGSSFNDGITIPKFIGNNYIDYLTYTKDLDFND